MRKIIEIEKLSEWEKIKNSSPGSETIILKYSTSCPISAVVVEDFNKWCADLSEDYNILYIKINVLESDILCRTLADEYKVKHQSPQVIWLTKYGTVKWTTSHYDINPRSLSAHLTDKWDVQNY